MELSERLAGENNVEIVRNCMCISDFLPCSLCVVERDLLFKEA